MKKIIDKKNRILLLLLFSNFNLAISQIHDSVSDYFLLENENVRYYQDRKSYLDKITNNISRCENCFDVFIISLGENSNVTHYRFADSLLNTYKYIFQNDSFILHSSLNYKLNKKYDIQSLKGYYQIQANGPLHHGYFKDISILSNGVLMFRVLMMDAYEDNKSLPKFSILLPIIELTNLEIR